LAPEAAEAYHQSLAAQHEVHCLGFGEAPLYRPRERGLVENACYLYLTEKICGLLALLGYSNEELACGEATFRLLKHDGELAKSRYVTEFSNKIS